MIMNRMTSLANTLASFVVGGALVVVALLFIVLGMTVLPVIGILLAVPVLRLSIYFLNPKTHLDDVEYAEGAVYEGAPFCLWPHSTRL